jgi:dihydrofolate reductase
MLADEDLHRHAVENFNQADALLFGRVTYEMMEAAWRPPARTGERPDWMEPWMEPFARTIDAAKKYVVSSTLERADWNAEFVRGDLGKAVQKLKEESGKGLFVAGVKLALALMELGLIDEYEFVVQPRLALPIPHKNVWTFPFVNSTPRAWAGEARRSRKPFRSRRSLRR